MAEDNIPFNNIPINLLVPGQYIEIDGSNALGGGLPSQNRRVLLIVPSSVTAINGKLYHVTSVGDAKALFGSVGNFTVGIQMVRAALKANPYAELYVLPMAIGAETHATGSIAFAGVNLGGPTTVFVYINGVRFGVPVTNTGDDGSGVVSSLYDAGMGPGGLGVEAGVSCTTGTYGALVLTALSSLGVGGNAIDLRVGYYDGERLPDGWTVTITPMSGGVGSFDATAIMTAIGDEPFSTIVLPWNDSTVLNGLTAWLDARWGPLQQNTSHVFQAQRIAHGDPVDGAFSGIPNSFQMSTLPVRNSPTPPWVWGALLGTVCDREAGIDPARPLQTVALPGVMAPVVGDRFTRDERESLLEDANSTFVVDFSGNAALERVVTMYVLNPDSGDIDRTWLDLETKHTVDYIRFAVRTRIATKFPRSKLADDGTIIAPGQPIVTPSILRNELIALFLELEQAGLVEDVAQFINDLQVVRSTQDVNRVNCIYPPNIVNQFRTFASGLKFIL